jgi:hypothetical protein
MCQDRPTVFVAATYGRLTGRPAVCISASVGMLNFCFIPKASRADLGHQTVPTGTFA